MFPNEQIACAVQFYGAHLPPLISAARSRLLSGTWPNFTLIKPSLTIGLNKKKKLWLKCH